MKLAHKKVKLCICSNPDCERPFDNLIVISDQSKNPSEKFYGCPHCFLKMDPTATNTLKKIEKIVEVEEPMNVNSLEEEITTDCPEYLGYLADNIMNSIIPVKCLDCEKINDCLKNNNKKISKKMVLL